MVLGLGSTMHDANVLFVINIWADVGEAKQSKATRKYKSYNKMDALIKAGEQLKIPTQMITDYSPEKYPGAQ